MFIINYLKSCSNVVWGFHNHLTSFKLIVHHTCPNTNLVAMFDS